MTTQSNGHEIPAYAGMTAMGVGSRLGGQGAARVRGDGARRALSPLIPMPHVIPAKA